MVLNILYFILHIELLHVSHLSSQLKPDVPILHSVRKTQIHNVPEKKRKNIIVFVIAFFHK
jgi:hypothetical protein